MEETSISTFDDLKKHVDDLLLRFGMHASASYSKKNSVLFRGQANHQWELESTLERASKRNWTLRRYLDLIGRIRPIIESYYNLPFSEPSRGEVENWLQNIAKEIGIVNIPGYDYLLYLRHHGFPSPFVDWTTSLYIAAEFAFFPENTSDY